MLSATLSHGIAGLSESEVTLFPHITARSLVTEKPMWKVHLVLNGCVNAKNSWTALCANTVLLPYLTAVVESLSRVQLFATPWTEACQACLSFTISQSLLKLMSSE